jgi:glucosamine--fructose-6-phosphate aminotransferase (isomerizing)
MCGIIGAVTVESVSETLLEGLKRLEYRGYDSAGVVLIESEVLKFYKYAHLNKSIEKLSKIAELNSSLATVGLAHTRWATHGVPNDVNAHPHADCTDSIGIVHNGIIENYRQILLHLEKKGHNIKSNTDSEVVAHLIEDNLLVEKQSNQDDPLNFVRAVRKSLNLLKGTYGIAAVSSDFPGQIVVAKNMSPIVVGLGNSGNYISSDVAAILEKADKFLYLKDNQIALITQDNLRLYDIDLNEIDFKTTEVTWSYADAQKLGHESFMLKEMYEQPVAFKNTLADRDINKLELFFDEIHFDPNRLMDIQKVFLVGCGTSFHSAMVAKYAIEHWVRIPVELDIASEFRYRDPILDGSTLVIGISQSGETIDTLAALNFARKSRAKIISVSNVVGSALTNNVDAVMFTRAGPEIGVAATKTYIGQLAVLLGFAISLGKFRGTLFKSEAENYFRELLSCSDKIDMALKRREDYNQLAQKLSGAKDFFFIGRNMGDPTSLEAALKLKEISYLHAEGYAAGELKHGPIAVLDDQSTVVGVATKNKLYDKVLSNLEEVRSRGANVFVVASDSDEEIGKHFENIFYVPDTFELFSPIVDIIPLQFLAYELAKLAGNDVDRPRNLAKTVTVE